MTYRDVYRGREFAPWLEALNGRSGVYVFRAKLTGTVLYVGESHTGNLARTIKRHFWTWNDRTKRHHYVVGVLPVEVAARITRASEAQDVQNRLILRLAPRHNLQTPSDEVPF